MDPLSRHQVRNQRGWDSETISIRRPASGNRIGTATLTRNALLVEKSSSCPAAFFWEVCHWPTSALAQIGILRLAQLLSQISPAKCQILWPLKSDVSLAHNQKRLLKN